MKPNARQRRGWAFAVFAADHYTCQDKGCPCHNDPLGAGPLAPHHIKLRSQGGLYVVENGIALCWCIAHKKAHEGTTIDGERVPANEYMILILESHENDPDFRHQGALDELRRRRKI